MVLGGLPLEIVYIVFGHLDKTDLMACLLVCKSWHHFLHAKFILWSSFEEYATQNLYGVPVSRHSGPRGVLHYTSPQRVELDGSISLDKSLRAVEISTRLIDRDLVWCVENLPHLQSLSLTQSAPTTSGIAECNPVVQLKSLRLYGDSESPDIVPELLVNVARSTRPCRIQLENVTSGIEPIRAILDLQGTIDFGFAAKGHGRATSQLSGPILSPLESLCLSRVVFGEFRQQPILPLRTLRIAESRLSDESSIGTILHAFGCEPTLELLELAGTQVGQLLPFSTRPMVRLESLRLSHLSKMCILEGNIIPWISHYLPRIRAVHIHGCDSRIGLHVKTVKPQVEVLVYT